MTRDLGEPYLRDTAHVYYIYFGQCRDGHLGQVEHAHAMLVQT